MNFELSEHHQMLQATLARYLSEQYPMERRLEGASSPSGYDVSAWREFGEQGFIGALCSEKLGGFGGTGLDLLVVFQELGRELVAEPFLPSALVAWALEHCSSAPEVFEKVFAGESVMALSLAGTDEGKNHMSLAAAADGGRFHLSGHQDMVAFAEAAESLLCFAILDDGLGLFKVLPNAPGLKQKGYPLIDGGRAADLEYDHVPAECLVQGESAEELQAALLARGRVALCAESLGCMEKACGMTVEYLRDRKQFGQPIGAFQALRHRLVDMLVEVDQARSLVINAANQLDSDDPTARDRAVSAAKYHVGKTGQHVAAECVQLHGGIGMTWEYPLGHYAKRLVMIDHQLGDSDFHLQAYSRLSG